MAWEVFTGAGFQHDQPGVRISAHGKMHINKLAAKRFIDSNDQYVELLFDRVRNLIGIRSCEKKPGAVGLYVTSQANGATVSCVSFLNHIGYDWSKPRNFPAQMMTNGMLVFEIPIGFLNHPPISRARQSQLRKRADDIGDAEASP